MATSIIALLSRSRRNCASQVTGNFESRRVIATAGSHDISEASKPWAAAVTPWMIGLLSTVAVQKSYWLPVFLEVPERRIRPAIIIWLFISSPLSSADQFGPVGYRLAFEYLAAEWDDLPGGQVGIT